MVVNDDVYGILRNPLLTNTEAIYNNSKVLVNGEQVEFQNYTIFGHNYFKLRDITEVLNGTESQFNIEWVADENMISIEKN